MDNQTQSTTTNSGYIISVSGYRNYCNYNHIKEILSQYEIQKIHVGDCKGVDSLVVQYCKEHHVPYRVFNADWSLGKKAGPIRNAQLIHETDLLIAFLSPESKGTASAIQIAKSKHIQVDVYHV